ncbi:MAG: DUF1684 domain-containing protein [Actinomycetota bacterium]
MTTSQDLVELIDYRRRVDDLYAAIRQQSDLEDAWWPWRAGRDGLFATHPQSPVSPERRTDFEGMAFHEYDPSWCLAATIEAVDDETVDLGHSGAGETRFVRFATLRAERLGEAITLDALWLDAYGGGIFVPFRDATNGDTTYGGGRYVLDAAKGADLGALDDGRLVLDLNYAYHPSCAHDARFSCPLAPPSNRLAMRVEAGELMPR